MVSTCELVPASAGQAILDPWPLTCQATVLMLCSGVAHNIDTADERHIKTANLRFTHVCTLEIAEHASGFWSGLGAWLRIWAK